MQYSGVGNIVQGSGVGNLQGYVRYRVRSCNANSGVCNRTGLAMLIKNRHVALPCGNCTVHGNFRARDPTTELRQAYLKKNSLTEELVYALNTKNEVFGN